jgi:hypothetical protein
MPALLTCEEVVSCHHLHPQNALFSSCRRGRETILPGFCIPQDSKGGARATDLKVILTSPFLAAVKRGSSDSEVWTTPSSCLRRIASVPAPSPGLRRRVCRCIKGDPLRYDYGSLRQTVGSASKIRTLRNPSEQPVCELLSRTQRRRSAKCTQTIAHPSRYLPPTPGSINLASHRLLPPLSLLAAVKIFGTRCAWCICIKFYPCLALARHTLLTPKSLVMG